MVSIPLENDIEFKEIEQQPIDKHEESLIIFSDHQEEVILYGLEPFASMLQSLEKHNFAQFMDDGYEFLLYVELSDPKFLFMSREAECELQSSGHLL